MVTPFAQNIVVLTRNYATRVHPGRLRIHDRQRCLSDMAGVAVRALVRWTRISVAWAMVGRPAEAQRDPYPVDSMRVEIHAWRDSSRVTTRLWFVQPVRVLDYTYLSNNCTTIGNLVARRGGLPVALLADTNPPWIGLHDTTDAVGEPPGPQAHELTYHVTHLSGARVAVPIVQPAGPLTARNAALQSKVRLTVMSEQLRAGEPVLPRFRAVASREWKAAMVAAPSHVLIATGGVTTAAACDSPVQLPGGSGGFLRLVTLLVTTIVLWIPLYFWWATRKRMGDTEGES